jgi:hypothetical protein
MLYFAKDILIKSWIKSLILLCPVLPFVMPGIVFAENDSFNNQSNLLPHRAFYSLSMGTSEYPGRFIDVSGFVNAALEKTCDGWITSEHVKMQVSLESNRFWNQELIYTGWESSDEKKYRFATRSSNNGKVEKYRGIAESNKNLTGKAIYSIPKKVTMKLPPGTQFYSGLTSWLIEKARSGAKRAETFVFNGTDLEGPQKAISFIIPIRDSNNLDAKFSSTISPYLNRPGWKMHIAFYSLGSQDTEPNYEVHATILDNGIIPKLKLVFTSFTTVQTLEKIEMIKTPMC